MFLQGIIAHSCNKPSTGLRQWNATTKIMACAINQVPLCNPVIYIHSLSRYILHQVLNYCKTIVKANFLVAKALLRIYCWFFFWLHYTSKGWDWRSCGIHRKWDAIDLVSRMSVSEWVIFHHWALSDRAMALSRGFWCSSLHLAFFSMFSAVRVSFLARACRKTGEYMWHYLNVNENAEAMHESKQWELNYSLIIKILAGDLIVIHFPLRYLFFFFFF